MTTKTYRSYIVGIILSIILAGGIASLAIAAITDSSGGWGIIMLVNAAIWFGGPLVSLILIVWLVYMVRDRGRVPGRVHALLFLPPLLALSIYPASLLMEQRQYDQFRAANPPISETHVNLSGNDLWIDTEPYASVRSGTRPPMPLSASQPDRFMNFIRYPSSDFVATGAFPYEGAHLKDTITEYVYQIDSSEMGTSLPMSRLAYPDLSPFSSISGQNEASMLRYIYFHYANRVDVAPSLRRLSGMTELELDKNKLEGLVLFRAQNYTSDAIVRLEINGQTLDIGDGALKAIAPRPQPCSSYIERVGVAFVDLNQPLDVRWQTLNDPRTWHDATLNIPPFVQPQRMDGESTLLRAQIYFLPDGTVEGERFVEVRPSEEQFGLRATGMPARAADYASCGSAYSGYNPQVVTLLAD